MITDETKFVQIRESKGWVTNIDERDLSEDFFLRVRGLLNQTSQKIIQRDYGTKDRYAAASYPVTNLTPTTVTLLENTSINDAVDNLEYDIVAGLDKDNHLHVWAWSYSLANGYEFTELTRILTAVISGAVPTTAGSPIGTTTEKENGVALAAGLPTGTYPNGMEGWVVVNAARSGVGIITASGSNGAHAFVLAGSNPGVGGLGWVAGDALTFYRTAGLYNASFNSAMGATPHVRWITNDTQRKATLLYGGSSTPVSAQTPLIFMRRAQRSYAQAGAATPGTPTYVLPAVDATSWFVESGGGLSTLSAVFGSKTAVKIGTTIYDSQSPTAPDTSNYPAASWIKITMQNTTGDGATPPYDTYSFVYVTIGYDDYQESDPIFKAFFGANTPGGVQEIVTRISINPALMPKNATQIRIYRYTVDLLSSLGDAAKQAFLGAIGDDQLLLNKTINLQKYTEIQTGAATNLVISTTPNDSYGRWIEMDYTSLRPGGASGAVNETSDSVLSNLGHDAMATRTILKPRFAARGTKQQGAVIVVDQDDTTLRVSSYNGGGAHEDDNFPGVTTDVNGSTLMVFLTSFGELLGLSINNDQIVALKRNAIELSDFQASQGQQTIQADVVAKRSIVQTPYGLVWAGASAIYILPSDGSEIKILNKGWKNWYDGTLLTANATPTPFLTLVQKTAIFSGYDPTYNAYWCVMTCQNEAGTGTEQLIARYYFEGVDAKGNPAARWDIRQLGGITASWLSRRKDTITIGLSSGMLFYPNNLGVGNFKDGVSSTDTGGTGIPLKALINLGSLFSLSVQNVFCAYKLDLKALGTGTFVTRFYLNDLTTATETKNNKISEPAHTRELPPWGSLRRLRMEIELVSDVGNITQFDINTIELHYIPRPSSAPGTR